MLSPQCQAQSLGPLNSVFQLLLQTLISSHCSISPPEIWPDDHGKEILLHGLQKYDFIVVGSASAESVVVNRLSENSHWNILVLSTGGRPPSESEVPLVFPTVHNSSIDPGLVGVRSKNFARGLVNGVPVIQPNVLGGYASFSNMLYIRGNKQDHRIWEKLGNPDWNYKDLLKYYKRSEDLLVKEILNSYGSKFHAVGGPLKVASFKYENTAKKILLEALKNIGATYLLDINSGENIGVTEATGTLIGGKRYSAVKAFLVPASKRPNVHVVYNADIISLNIDKHKNVNGVNFKLGRKKFTAVAKNEYILGAGIIKGSQLLKLSGLGPANELKRFGIPVVCDLPGVGENLQDHALVPYFLEYSCDCTFGKDDIVDEYFKYLTEKSGIFSTTCISDVVTFQHTDDPKCKYPNIQITYTPYSKGNVQQLVENLKAHGYGGDVIDHLVSRVKEKCLIQISVILLNPESRGKVLLKSKDSHVNPEIYLNYLDHAKDLEILIHGIRHQQKLLGTKAFRGHHINEVVLHLNECGDLKYNSDPYWECYVRYLITSNQEYVGTLKMGPKKDKLAVVDHNLKVHGVNNLRVVGPAVFPTITSGYILAPIILTGEKAAEIIKKQWKKV